jgi:phenylacetate-CoA ligase
MTQHDRQRRYLAPEWEQLDRATLEARQFEQLKQKLTELSTRNPFYARRWSEAGVDLDKVVSPESFREVVPTISKRDLLDDQDGSPPFGSFLGVDPSELAQMHVTSGTSGVGQGAFGLTANDVALVGQSYAHMWTNAGLSRGDVGILTYPVTFLAAGLIGVASSQAFGLVPIFGFGIDKRLVLELAQKFGAATIFGTPSVLRELQRVATAEGIDPRRDLKGLKALCTGLTGPPYGETIGALQDFWGVPVFENYGQTETGQATGVSCEQGVWDGERRYPIHFLEHMVHCEVLDPESGQPVADGEFGELVITAFRREASPAIRYRTGDRVMFASHESCPCGRPFNGMVPGEVSRYDDMKKIKGTTVWPASVDGIVFARPEVDEYRVVLTRDERGRESLTIQLAVTPEVAGDAARAAALTAELRDAVKLTTLVQPEVEIVPDLAKFDFKAKRWFDER